MMSAAAENWAACAERTVMRRLYVPVASVWTRAAASDASRVFQQTAGFSYKSLAVFLFIKKFFLSCNTLRKKHFKADKQKSLQKILSHRNN